MQYFRGRRGTSARLWLPVSILCAVLVLGFLLFDVLDVDGSDSPRSPANMTAKLVDPPQNDARRGLAFVAPLPDLSAPTAVLVAVAAPTDIRPAPAARARRPVLSRGTRVTLARAVLSDGPAAG